MHRTRLARDRWGVRSEWLGGYHSKTMGLGSSYFANFTSAQNECIEHGLRAIGTGISLAAKCEYSNNTLNQVPA